MNEKKYIPVLVLLLAVISFGVYYLFFMNSFSKGNPWKMIPDTPALIIESDQPHALYENLSDKNEIWKAMSEAAVTDRIDHRVFTFDSIFRNNRTLWQSIGSSPCYLALFYDQVSKHKQLLLLSQPKKLPTIEYLKNFLQQQLGSGFAVLYDDKGAYSMLKILDGKDNSTGYLSLVDGVLIYTHQRALMEKAWQAYHSGAASFYADSSFQKVKQTSGKKVAARIFVNYPMLAKLLSNGVSSGFKGRFQQLKHWAQWSEFDLLLKDNDATLTGYTIAAKTDLLAKFKAQKPVKTRAFSLYPFNTNLSVNLGFSDFSGYSSPKILNRFKPAYQPDIKQLIKQTAHEVCYVSNALDPREQKNKSWAIIGLRNAPDAALLLKKLAYKSGYRNYKTYSNYRIRKINVPGLLKNIYGELFRGITANYYTILDGYAVFANSPEAVIRMIQYSETGKTLDLNENFKSFSNSLAESSNILLLIQLRSFTDLLKRYLTPAVAKGFLERQELMNNMQGFAIQYSHDGNMFYTNVYLRYNKRYKEENLALWKVRLRDEIVGKPFLVKDHSSGHFDVIVFDKGKRMYLINPEGRILWAKRLPELPVSKIYQVDYYKNGKIQFLFNTAHQIFLIDRKGNYVANYPIRLQPAATNGLSLFDYTNRKDYRILIAQADKHVYDYNIRGNQVKGWQKPRTQNIVLQKVVRLMTNHKDYILITDISGNVSIVNRRGARRIYLKGKLQKAKNSSYYVNRTNSKGIILTTDRQGRLVYVSSGGMLQFTDFGKFSPEHYFLYEDFNGDFSHDFIFIDHKKLTVFNRFKKVLFSYSFPDEIHVQPEFFTLGRNQKVLGVVDSAEKAIYLFDKDGNILISTGLTGETPFTVGSLYNNGDVNLITAAGNTLFNYRIK